MRDGIGFGGGCLPKDIRAFMARAGELGADQALTFLREIDSINMRQRGQMVELARQAPGGGSFLGKRGVSGSTDATRWTRSCGVGRGGRTGRWGDLRREASGLRREALDVRVAW